MGARRRVNNRCFGAGARGAAAGLIGFQTIRRKTAGINVNRLWETAREEVWETDLKSLPRWRRAGVLSFRIIWKVASDLHAGQLNLRAMSLVYTTILSLVPLLAISFSVLKGFGVHEQLYDLSSQLLEPLGEQGKEIGDRIFGFVENVKVGVLGSVGLVLLIYTVISLIQKIEFSFNFIWKVSQTRPLARRFSDYLSVVLVGPVLVFSAIGVKASLMNNSMVQSLQSIEPFGTLLQFISSLLPIALVIGAFTFIYVFMPNTRVKLTSALVGALAASLMWNAVSWAFASFVVSSAQYTAIYSAFAALILFMLWLYFAWLVLLAGAAIAYYHQNPDRLSGDPSDTMSPRFQEWLGVAIMVESAAAFQRGAPPPSEHAIAESLSAPGMSVSELIGPLSADGLIVATGESEVGWLPARPPEQIPVNDVVSLLRAHNEAGAASLDQLRITARVRDSLAQAEESGRGALSGKSISDLCAS